MEQELLTDVKIREINVADAPIIANLSAQLGYKLDTTLARAQIATLRDDKSHFAFVAMQDNALVGYIHGFRAIRLTASPFIEISALIVNEQHRGKGIGKMLVEHFEQHANPGEVIRVRCNVMRRSAHRFYKGLRYVEKKEQKIFEHKP